MKITVEITTTSAHGREDDEQADVVLSLIRSALSRATGMKITGFSWGGPRG